MKKNIFYFSILLFPQALAQPLFHWVKPLEMLGSDLGQKQRIAFDLGESNKNHVFASYIYHDYQGYHSNTYRVEPFGAITVIDTSTQNLNISFQVKDSCIYSVYHRILTRRRLNGIILSRTALDSIDKNGFVMHNNNIYTINGGLAVSKFKNSGILDWKVELHPLCTLHEIVESKGLYVRSVIYSDQYFGGRIYKLDTLGNILWQINGSGNRIVPGKQGNIYVCKYLGLTKHSADGGMIWDTYIPRAGFHDAFERNDSVYACGSLGFKSAMFILSASTGQVLRTDSFDFALEGTCRTQSLMRIFPGTTGIYSTGYYCSESNFPFIVKFGESDPTYLKGQQNANVLLNIFPNPTGRLFTVSGQSTAGSFQVELKNVLGKRVYSTTIYPLEEHFSELIDPGVLPKGVYFVEIFGIHPSTPLRMTTKVVIE
jgi:hypothetical protein